jgi:hypothetical protein
LIEAYDQMSPEQKRQATDACRRFRLMVSGSAALPGAPSLFIICLLINF